MHKNEEMQKTYYGKALEIINLFRYKNFQIYIILINWLQIIVEKKINVLKEKNWDWIKFIFGKSFSDAKLKTGTVKAYN